MKSICCQLFGTLFILVFGFPFTVSAINNLNAGIAQLPVAAESPDKGVFIDLCHAISKETGVPIRITVTPFARSIRDIIQRKVDFHIPLIQNPLINPRELPFDYSTATIFITNFVLYTNKANPVDPDHLDNYVIETDSAHTDYFLFKTTASTCIECSLKKIQKKRIDGYIFADCIADIYVKRNNMNELRRQLYKKFKVKIVLQKGAQGGEVDRFLSEALDALEKKGALHAILAPLAIPYENWQP